ncbi:MAG: threonylcarbamoyl-AMP synthase [Deltaproteobacteria bacterium]|nr:threonylcarbamoyl-AMP synthase [Deltaproteobacteria bacterium]
MIVSPTADNIRAASKIIVSGGTVVFPTETVYGLGANALDELAVRKVYALKSRPIENPLIVHVKDSSQIQLYTDLSDSEVKSRLELLESLWPGPLTVVLPSNGSIPDIVTAKQPTIAVRVPAHPVAQELLNECRVPIAAPSANPSSALSPTSAEHIASELKADIILDGGRSKVGIESTIIALIGPVPLLLRPGSLTVEELQEVLKEEIADVSESPLHIEGESLISPGMLPKHYSPRTPLIFIRDFNPSGQRSKRVGYIGFKAPPEPDQFDYAASMVLSSNGDMQQVAANLYAALHDMDGRSLDLIVIDDCERSGIGKAIMNRLSRAVSQK